MYDPSRAPLPPDQMQIMSMAPQTLSLPAPGQMGPAIPQGAPVAPANPYAAQFRGMDPRAMVGDIRAWVQSRPQGGFQGTAFQDWLAASPIPGLGAGFGGQFPAASQAAPAAATPLPAPVTPTQMTFPPTATKPGFPNVSAPLNAQTRPAPSSGGFFGTKKGR